MVEHPALRRERLLSGGGYSPVVVADPGDFFDLPPARVAVLLIDFQNDFCSPLVAGNGPVHNTGNGAAAVRANRFAGSRQ